MSAETVSAWEQMTTGIKDAGMVSYALVAVDGAGQVHYGANFGTQPEDMLRRLREIESDIKRHIKKNG